MTTRKSGDTTSVRATSEMRAARTGQRIAATRKNAAVHAGWISLTRGAGPVARAADATTEASIAEVAATAQEEDMTAAIEAIEMQGHEAAATATRGRETVAAAIEAIGTTNTAAVMRDTGHRHDEKAMVAADVNGKIARVRRVRRNAKRKKAGIPSMSWRP